MSPIATRACVAAALLTAGIARAVSPTYVLTPVDMACAHAINRDATVAGMNHAGHAAVYRDGVTTDLGTLGGHFSWALAVNNRGRVVGGSLDGNGDIHAFVGRRGPMKPLLPGLEGNSEARGIDNAGRSVGWAIFDGEQHAFLYDAGQLIDLGTLGDRWSVANDINNVGQVVGTLSDGLSSGAFLYENGAMKDLGSLGGNSSSASAINDAGEIVGDSNLFADGPLQAFIYRHGVMEGLGRLHGAEECRASAINRHTEVVGHCIGAGFGTRAYIWRGGRMRDLTALVDPVSGAGWTLQYAHGINDAGQIVGCGQRESFSGAFLLTPL